MGKTDSKLPPTEAYSVRAEVKRLREENVCLRGLLIDHGIRIPEGLISASTTHPVTNLATGARNSGVGTAEQRIALFRSLFRGRDDVYAIRWESADGRSGYMPKADRDWKSYLRAKDEDRKKVDRLTRQYRQLTDDAVREHLVGEHTVGLYPLLQDETCWLLAVDFDKKTWQQDATAFIAACSALNVPAALEAHAQGTVAMCGYSLSEQSQPQSRESLAVQSSLEPWNLVTNLDWIHMTVYSPTRTQCPGVDLAT